MVEGARLEIVYSVKWVEGSNPSRSAIFRMIRPTPEEAARRDEIVARIREYTEANRRVNLPVFDPALERPDDRFALISVGIEPNVFSGTVGSYRYQFEGEEDLLHMIVTSAAGGITAEEGQAVGSFVLAGVPTALVWLKPGERSQHLYVGHDEVARHAIVRFEVP